MVKIETKNKQEKKQNEKNSRTLDTQTSREIVGLKATKKMCALLRQVVLSHPPARSHLCVWAGKIVVIEEEEEKEEVDV